MLGFIRNLYYQSEIVVGMGGDQTPFKLRRGLRQGCPMSPILFDIFINDLYGKPGVKRIKLGVTVPGVKVEEEGLLSGKTGPTRCGLDLGPPGSHSSCCGGLSAVSPVVFGLQTATKAPFSVFYHVYSK
jgi:hypothetical protein